MKKKIIITILLALVAVAGQAKTYKRIIAPEAMASVNCELTADEVVFTDTATTVRFTKKGDPRYTFRIISSSYLMDEDGNHYLLRSAEGIRLDEWVATNADSINHFTMHFEPMPKRVKVFDFIEGDVRGAFMLLGIHDKNTKLKAPSLKELSDAYPWTLPEDWFKTDSVCIRGRFEGYNAEQFGFTSLECYLHDVFNKDDGVAVMDIAPDGTFEKRWLANQPLHDAFFATGSRIDFSSIPFFVRPGETIDITIRKNEHGKYECYYNNGSCKEVERWLKAPLQILSLFRLLHYDFQGTPAEMRPVAEQMRQNVLWRIDNIARREQFTPMEMQLALAEADLGFAYAILDYFMYRADRSMKQEFRDGNYYNEVVDSIANKDVRVMENYDLLRLVNFDNPLLLCLSDANVFSNRLNYASPVIAAMYTGEAISDIEEMERFYAATQELLGSKHNTLMAQMCRFVTMQNDFKNWRGRIESLKAWLEEHPRVAESQGEELLAKENRVEDTFAAYFSSFTHPYLQAKAQAFYDEQMAITELSTPLPTDNAAADLIRKLSAKYPGRYLFIDFWQMGCGPCRGAIQQSKDLRAEIAKRDDVKLIFICGEPTSEGSEAYKKYVAEWLADEETVCTTYAEFSRLQELFRFSGIPHYETITPDCRRVRDDLRLNGLYNFEQDMKSLKDRLK